METVAAFTNLEDQEIPQLCPLLGLTGRNMQLKLAARIGVGSAVKVETGDTLTLGEVSYCHPVADGYVVGVEINEALHNVAELTRLARALLA